MKISFNEATASNCSSLAEDLWLCEESGFDFIELRGDMLLDYLKTHDVEELQQFFATHHLKPHAMNALYTYIDMFHPEKADVERDRALLAYFISCCHVAQQIGNHYFVVVPDLLDDADNIYLPHDPNNRVYPFDNEAVKENYIRILRRLSAIAEKYDVRLGFEPVGSMGCAVRDIEHAWEIVKETNRENVGLVVDSFNLHLNGKLNDFSRIAEADVDKIFMAHINNCDDLPLGKLDHGDRRFVDSGEIDLDNYLSVLKGMGYDGPVSIETFRQEYYEWKAEDVIKQAYETTASLVKSYE